LIPLILRDDRTHKSGRRHRRGILGYTHPLHYMQVGKMLGGAILPSCSPAFVLPVKISSFFPTNWLLRDEYSMNFSEDTSDKLF
jgi:hypothetical protein